MGESEFCRVCADFSDTTNPLFEGSLRKLLPKITDITGLKLKNIKELPENICKSCEKEILQAHRFRDRVIKVQERYRTLCYQSEKEKLKIKRKRKANDSPRFKEETPPIEEVIFDGSHEFKTEDANDNSNNSFTNLADDSHTGSEDELSLAFETSLMLPLISKDNLKAHKKPEKYMKDGEVLLLNSESEKTDENRRDEDTLTIEPEICSIADENPLSNKIEFKPRKKPHPKSSEKPKRAYGEEHNWICDLCGKHFTVKSHFKMHILRHSGNKQYPCKLCARGYYSITDLNRHMLTHTGERPYPCKYCELRFNDRGHLTMHTRRQHTNERPFVCDQCPKTFHSSCNFKAHIVIHSGLRAHICKLCNVSYKRKTHLTRHHKSAMHKQNQEKQKQKPTSDYI